MTSQVPENFSTWLVDWCLVTSMGNTMPPRDPNDDDDEDEEGPGVVENIKQRATRWRSIQFRMEQPIAKHGGRWIFSSVISLLETLAQQRHKAMHRAFRNISRLHLCYMSNKTMDCTGHLSLQGE